MHLTDRGGGDRELLELGEPVAPLGAELGADLAWRAATGSPGESLNDVLGAARSNISSFRADDPAVVPARPSKSGRATLHVVAGNTNEGGLFAPIVVVARNIIGVKRFNQIRGKAIALHSQVRPEEIAHREQSRTRTRVFISQPSS